MENIFKNNLRFIRKKIGLTQDEFAKPLNIKGTSISAMELGKSNPSNAVLELIEIKYRINRIWLKTGEGKMNMEPEPKKEIQVNEETPLYKVGILDDDPETAGLLSMTREILKSGTEYSVSLAANVRSFHNAIKTEKRLNKMEEKILKMDDKFKQADRIRNEDSEVEKSTILKKRAM